MLGPSGCGKTTTLRMIGGLEEVAEGKIYIAGEDVTDLPPSQRDTSMMFQSFALFPHRNVHRNVEFSLKVRGENEVKFSLALLINDVIHGEQPESIRRHRLPAVQQGICECINGQGSISN